MMCGGASQARPADAEDQGIIDQVRAAVEKKLGQNFAKYEAVLVSTQVVAGVNYFVKVKTGDVSFIHLRVYKPLPHTNEGPQLHGVLSGLGEADDLKYFEQQS